MYPNFPTSTDQQHVAPTITSGSGDINNSPAHGPHTSHTAHPSHAVDARPHRDLPQYPPSQRHSDEGLWHAYYFHASAAVDPDLEGAHGAESGGVRAGGGGGERQITVPVQSHSHSQNETPYTKPPPFHTPTSAHSPNPPESIRILQQSLPSSSSPSSLPSTPLDPAPLPAPPHFDMAPPPPSTHPTWAALHAFAQSHASAHGYALSINTTSKNRTRIKLACVCYGKPKNTHKLTPETRVRKNRISAKTGCGMWVEGKRVVLGEGERVVGDGDGVAARSMGTKVVGGERAGAGEVDPENGGDGGDRAEGAGGNENDEDPQEQEQESEGERVVWVLRVGEPSHNHPGRPAEHWAVQRKRTWGLVGGRVGVGGVTALEEKRFEEERAKRRRVEGQETGSPADDGDAVEPESAGVDITQSEADNAETSGVPHLPSIAAEQQQPPPPPPQYDWQPGAFPPFPTASSSMSIPLPSPTIASAPASGPESLPGPEASAASASATQSLVYRIVEEEMHRQASSPRTTTRSPLAPGPNHPVDRDRGVGHTVKVLQERLPGIRIFKRDVYNIRAQIKRAQKMGSSSTPTPTPVNEKSANIRDGERSSRRNGRGGNANTGQAGLSRGATEAEVEARDPAIDPALEGPGRGSEQESGLGSRVGVLERENAGLRSVVGQMERALQEKEREIERLRVQAGVASALSRMGQ